MSEEGVMYAQRTPKMQEQKISKMQEQEHYNEYTVEPGVKKRNYNVGTQGPTKQARSNMQANNYNVGVAAGRPGIPTKQARPNMQANNYNVGVAAWRPGIPTKQARPNMQATDYNYAIQAEPRSGIMKTQRKLSPEEAEAMKAQQAKDEEEERKWAAEEKAREERRAKMTPEELARNNAKEANEKVKRKAEAMAMREKMAQKMSEDIRAQEKEKVRANRMSYEGYNMNRTAKAPQTKTSLRNLNISTNMNRSAKALKPIMAPKGYAGKGYGGNNGQAWGFAGNKKMKTPSANVGMSAQVSRNGGMSTGVGMTTTSSMGQGIQYAPKVPARGQVRTLTPEEREAQRQKMNAEHAEEERKSEEESRERTEKAIKASSGNVAMGAPKVMGETGTPGVTVMGRAGRPGVAGMGEAGTLSMTGVGEVAKGPTGGPPMDITPLVTALTTINNTLIGSLASIESRAKKNDINPALVNMNDFLSQINSSLPYPTQGGGGDGMGTMMSGKPKSKGKSKSKKKSKAKPSGIVAAPATTNPVILPEVPGTIGGVITVLSQINTTLQTSLAAIEDRLKKNDVNPGLSTLNDYLSQINDSLPIQEGGGTRRSRMKKRNKTLRNRRA